MATEKQKQAINNLVGNGGNKTKAMIDAGYSPNTANTPQKLTESEGFKEEIEPFVKRLEKERERIFKAMVGKRLDSEEYKVLVESMNTVTKNVQLLSGGETDRIGISELTDFFKKRMEYASERGNSETIQNGSGESAAAD